MKCWQLSLKLSATPEIVSASIYLHSARQVFWEDRYPVTALERDKRPNILVHCETPLMGHFIYKSPQEFD